MRPHLARQAATGRSEVAAVGVAQEFQRVWAAIKGTTSTGTPRWSFCKADHRVTCYYFYLWDDDFGPAFVKVCAYFPYPGKIWINGHEWAKRQASKAGIGFTELSNGFAAPATNPKRHPHRHLLHRDLQPAPGPAHRRRPAPSPTSPTSRADHQHPPRRRLRNPRPPSTRRVKLDTRLKNLATKDR